MIGTALEAYRLSKQRSSEGHLPLSKQLMEMVALEVLVGIGPRFYHEAQLWKRELPFEQKRRYLLGKRYNKAVSRINPTAYYKLSQHKLAEKSLLQTLHIPTPTLLGFYSSQSGKTADGAPLKTTADLYAFLSTLVGQRICFKRVEGSGGKGFLAASVLSSDTIATLWDGDSQPLKEFIEAEFGADNRDAYVIESYLEQHAAMAALNPTSVNTIRIWVREDHDEVQCVGALVRIGAEGKLTDNTSSGGLCATIDLESGRIGSARFLDGRHHYHETHPGHGAQIEGIDVPFWNEALSTAKETIRSFPRIRFAGLDVAISTSGPTILELNVEPDPIHAAVIGKPTLDLLGLH